MCQGRYTLDAVMVLRSTEELPADWLVEHLELGSAAFVTGACKLPLQTHVACYAPLQRGK